MRGACPGASSGRCSSHHDSGNARSALPCRDSSCLDGSALCKTVSASFTEPQDARACCAYASLWTTHPSGQAAAVLVVHFWATFFGVSARIPWRIERVSNLRRAPALNGFRVRWCG
jgi:hypothetical protein